MSSLQRYFQGFCLGFGLLVLLSACSQPLSSQAATSTPTRPAPTAATTKVSQSCPTSGTARAAVMPAMPAGNHPNLVYSSHSNATTTVWRYDTTTASTTKLLTASWAGDIVPDGQWMLLVAKTENQWALQLIRLDGQQLQTLYCAPFIHDPLESDPLSSPIFSDVLVSLDQRALVFVQKNSRPDEHPSASLYTLERLDLTTGRLQRLYSAPFFHNLSFSPDQRSLLFFEESYDPLAQPKNSAAADTLDQLDLATGKVQKLYSAGSELGNLLFSPDQRSLAFVEGADPNIRWPRIIHVLDLATGKQHAVVSNQQAGDSTSASWTSANSLVPIRWINNHELLIRIAVLTSPILWTRLYLLHDSSKNVAQQQSNLQYITGSDDLHDACRGADVTPDNQQLVCSNFADHPEEQIPATIKIRPLTGGVFHTIYHATPTDSVTVNIISNSTLLILHGQADHPETVMKMNIDGSGQVQLMAALKTSDSIRDIQGSGSLYALEMYSESETTTLVVGALAGGAPKTVVTTPDDLTILGWIQM